MIRLFQPDLWTTESDDNCICSVTADDNYVFLHSHKLRDLAEPCLIWNCEDIFPSDYCHYKKKTNFIDNSSFLTFSLDKSITPKILIFYDNDKSTDAKIIEQSQVGQYIKYKIELYGRNINSVKIILPHDIDDTISVKIYNSEYLCDENVDRDKFSVGEVLDLNQFCNYTPKRLIRELTKLGFNGKSSFKLSKKSFILLADEDRLYCQTPVTLNIPTEKWLKDIHQESSQNHIISIIIEASNNLPLIDNMQIFDASKKLKIASALYHDNSFCDYEYINQLNNIFNSYHFCYNFYFDKYYSDGKYTFFYPVTDADYDEDTQGYKRLWSDENAYNNEIGDRIRGLVEDYFNVLASKLSNNVILSTKINVDNSFFNHTRDVSLVDVKNYSMFNFENNCYNDCKFYVELPSDALGTVSVGIDDQIFNADVINGVATVRLSGVNGGLHNALVSFESRDEKKYASKKWVVNLSFEQTSTYTPYINPLIKLSSPVMTVPVVNEDIKNSVTLSISNSDMNKVINGVYDNGKINFTMPDLIEGDYNCKLHFIGDSVYEEKILEKSLSYEKDDKYRVKFYSDLILNKKSSEPIAIDYKIDGCLIPVDCIANTGVISDVFFYVDSVDDYYVTGNFLYNCRALLNQSVAHSHGLFNVTKDNWSKFKSLIKISSNNLNLKLINNFYDFLDWGLIVQDFIVPVSYYISGENVYFHYAGDDNVVYESKKNLIVKDKGVIVENPQSGVPAYVITLEAFGSELLCGNIIDNIFTALQMSGIDETILIVDFDGINSVSDQFCESYFKFLLSTKNKVITINMSVDVSNIFGGFVYNEIEMQEA